ncbi:MAG: signal peptide peptidase SppA [Rhodothermia bacterium]
MRFFPTVIASLFGTLIAFGVIFFFLLLLIAGLSTAGKTAPSVRPGSVLVVPISGRIPESAPENPFQVVLAGPGRVTLHQITRAIRNAADDDRISAIWLKPSGSANSWAALEELTSALSDFRSSGKPIVASSGASGYSEKDFFLAMSADHVFSPPAAYFELNGFVIVLQFVKQLFDKLDIEVEVVRAGNFKSAVEPFLRDHASDENREQLRALLDAHSDLFIDTIVARRNLQPGTVLDLIDQAKVTSAEQALEAGLIDSLITDDDVSDFLIPLTGHEGWLRTTFVDAYARSNPGSGGTEGTVAIVNAFGTIVSGKSSRDGNPLFSGTNVGSATLTEFLKKVRDDESIDAVVVRINSPGGSAAASDVIWRAIKKTGEVKPVVASLGGVAASGGYYIAAAADTIIAERTTLTGSIGVFTLLLNVSGLLEDKIGLTHDAIKSGPYADMFTGLRSLSDNERAILADGVDRTYDRFTALVAEGRGMPIEDVHSIAQGRIWAGSDALRLGLIDTLGGLYDAVRIAALAAGLGEDNYGIRTYPRPRGLFEQLTELVESTGASVLDRFSGSGPAEWFAMHVRVLNAASDIHGSPQAMLPMTVSVE